MRLHWSEANVNLKPQLYVSVVIFEIVELLFNKELISFFIRYGLWREDLINHKSTSRLSAGVLCRETLRLEVFEKSMLNRAFLPQPVLNDWNFLMMRNISLASGLLGVIIDSGYEKLKTISYSVLAVQLWILAFLWWTKFMNLRFSWRIICFSGKKRIPNVLSFQLSTRKTMNGLKIYVIWVT